MSQVPVITAREFLRALRNLGFMQIRQTGSHLLVRKRTGGPIVPVPIHHGRTIPRGTLMGIIRDLGIPTAEFLKTLRRR